MLVSMKLFAKMLISLKGMYVGSTTNLIQRRKQHKRLCNNENERSYTYYVYQFIRENGGFENWDVVLIEELADCEDKQNLHKRERYYIEGLKAELNENIPLRTHKEWIEANENHHKNQQKTIVKIIIRTTKYS